MKKLLMIVISLLFIAPCGRDNLPLVPGLEKDFFPLQVGNKWIFRSSLDSSIITYEITDTKNLNQHDYFQQVRTFSDGTKDTNYFRVSDDNVVLIFYQGNEYIYINFDMPLNEEWNSYGNNYGYIKQKNILVNVSAGSFNDVTEVYLGNRTLPDGYEINRFSPGIGLIEVSMFRLNLKLNSAQVNGINYP